MPSTGIDVSTHQGSVDWQKVAAAGHRFAICKCSEGEDFRDKTWNRARVRAVRKAGLRLGAYHYLRPRPGRTGDVEARFAVTTAKAAGWGRPGDIELAVDVEETDLSGARATRRYVQQFAREYRRLTGRWPLLYTFPSFAETVGFGGWLARRCPLWIAHLVPTPSVPGAWRRFAIHQHSFTGRVHGVDGDVDLNRARDLPLIPKPPRPVPVKLTLRQRLVRSYRRRRARYIDTRTDAALRRYLFAKARLGKWDRRYLLHFGPNGDVNARVKAFVTRGFAAGLVPTSLRRAPRFAGDNSHHTRGNAGDMGVRRELLPLGREGVERMAAFQRAEFARRRSLGHTELIGPVNRLVILRGAVQPLGEGTALETQHDNHVHGAFT